MFHRGAGRSTGRPRRVLVTGAASGLGLEFARVYLGRGDRVTLTDIHETPPSPVTALSGDWSYRKLDVTDEADWAAAAQEVGSLDVLVSNAGIGVGGRITGTSLATWRRALDINLLGSVRGVRAMLPRMGGGGQIVLTASLAGLVHAPSMAAYNATKAATVALGETLDGELRCRGISVTTVCPQFFRSGLAGSLTGDDASADRVARSLLKYTWLDAATVARRGVRGADARRVTVTPDAFATLSWYSKRFTRVPYLLVMRLIGRWVDRRLGPS
ncbi:SDR family NAD(P)-dependent oxidoreductase [Corynebacterium provencense]|uniref:SDR family NAD(P)-dependent oxidoreductase n=1 Tax=Corynebacterium provencense TaxID=1737425 RepID=UPI000B20F3AE|nr:SDR family NAD(P)-dependent oxidoreductase [Corynebacterium provencense]MCI1255167.1 SDR family NAD(P)-dependent oxidoreductase [Corynebacterium provencense]